MDENTTATGLVSQLQALIAWAQAAERFELHAADGTYKAVAFDPAAANNLQAAMRSLPDTAARFDAAAAEYEARVRERDQNHD